MVSKTKKLLAIGLVLVMVAVAFSAAVTNVVAEKGGEEKTVVSLNPCAATDGNTHIVWQENLTDQMEIYYSNDAQHNYETTLTEAIEELSGFDDKDSQKALENLNDALEKCLEQDYKHSIDKVHKAVKNLEKTENTQLIHILVDAVRDFAKTNILYAEYDLSFNNSYIQEAWGKYYFVAVEKYEEKNYDAAIKQFKNSYLKIVEAYEEISETFIGTDFGKIVRISYTDYDSVNPQIFLNGTINVGWIEKTDEGDHVYYARSTNNGVTWWYSDATAYAAPYLNYWGVEYSEADSILEVMSWIKIIGWSHYLYGRITYPPWVTPVEYAPVDDPYLTTYIYDDFPIGDDIFHIPRRCPLPNGEPPKAPDLTVSDISFLPNNYATIDGYPINLYALIENIGDASISGTIYINFYDDSTHVGDYTLSYIGVNETTEATIPLTATGIGTHVVTVMIDTEGVDDGNITNNEMTRDVINLVSTGDYDYDILDNYNEVYTYSTNPLVQDTDDDGLNDNEEITGWDIYPIGGISYHTASDPTRKHTDNDGLSDSLECALGTDPGKGDTDEDGLIDGIEDTNRNGIKDPEETDPLNPDTDGDGLFDGNTNTVLELRLRQIDVSSSYNPEPPFSLDPFYLGDDSIWNSAGEFYILVGDNEVRYPKCYPYYWSISSGESKIVNELIAVKYYQEVTITVMVRVWEDDLWWDDEVGTFTISVNGEESITANNDKVTLHFTSTFSFFADPNPTSVNADNDGMNDFYEVVYLSDRVFDFRVEDTDRDGLINLVDPDSDNDGLLDGNANSVIMVGLEKMYVADDHDYLSAGEIYIYVDSVRYPSSGTWSINSGETKYLWIFTRIKLLPCVVTVQVIVKEEDLFSEETIGRFTAYIYGAGTTTVGNSDVTLYFESTEYSFNDPSPLRADTDGDGINDKDEINYLSTRVKDFTSRDTDSDSIKDYLDWDSDNDGLSDGVEIKYDIDPLYSDSDNDGLIDGDEPYWNTDSDGDGVINALDPNSDNDGYTLDGSDPDPLAVDTDADGLLDTTENSKGTDPNNPDTDGDGVNDGTELYWEMDSDNDGLINALDTDSDDDGLWDGFQDLDSDDTFDLNSETGEDINGNGIIDPGETNPLNSDSDNDGLNDGEEIVIGSDGYITDPNNSDSDGDYALDGEEVQYGISPVLYQSYWRIGTTFDRLLNYKYQCISGYGGYSPNEYSDGYFIVTAGYGGAVATLYMGWDFYICGDYQKATDTTTIEWGAVVDSLHQVRGPVLLYPVAGSGMYFFKIFCKIESYSAGSWSQIYYTEKYTTDAPWESVIVGSWLDIHYRTESSIYTIKFTPGMRYRIYIGVESKIGAIGGAGASAEVYTRNAYLSLT